MATAIKIYDSIWITKRHAKSEWDSEQRKYVPCDKEEELAYICQYGTDSAFKKRKETGMNWSHNTRNPDGHVFKNDPVEGFKIGRSVSRYSTDNKVFRLEDPRGFTVEISTGNLEILLRDTDIIKGVIQGKCVWGREDKNILLSVNSKEYKDAFDMSDKLISVKDLNPGDKVLMQNGLTYIYAGKAEIVFDIPVCVLEYRESTKAGYTRDSRYKQMRTFDVSVPSQHYFLDERGHTVYDYTNFDRTYNDNIKINKYVTFSNPKIAKIISTCNNIGKFDESCWYENAQGDVPGHNENKLRDFAGLCSKEQSQKNYNEFYRGWNRKDQYNPEFIYSDGRIITKIYYK